MKNKFFCVIGVDGSGKTTICRRVIKQLDYDGNRYCYVWGNLSAYFMIVVRKFGKDLFDIGLNEELSNFKNYQKRKHEIAKKHSFLSWIYLLLSLIEYIPQIWLKMNIRLLLGYSVISDRYIYDRAIDLAMVLGKDMEWSMNLVRKLTRIVPIPEYVFFLNLPDELAFSRKGDIPSVEYISERRKYYERMAFEFNFRNVSVDRNIEDVTKDIVEAITNMPRNGNQK